MATVTPSVGNGCVGTFPNGDVDVQFKCLKKYEDNGNPVYVCTGKRYFLVTCSKINRQCSQFSGAFVAAITVCNQRLF